MELNRILRPGGFFIWSATPVYLKDEEHQKMWKGFIINLSFLFLLSFSRFSQITLLRSLCCLIVFLFSLSDMTALTEAICWKLVNKTFIDSLGIGVAIYQKPSSSSSYISRKEDNPPVCEQSRRPNNISWYEKIR